MIQVGDRPRLTPLRIGLYLLVAVAVGTLVALAWGPGELRLGERALLFALPALILLAMDWIGAGVRDVDFALGADIALLVGVSGVYGVLFVVIRRVCSTALRGETGRARGLDTAAYVLVPPVMVGAAWALTAPLWSAQAQLGGVTLAAAVLGLLYVSLDAVFGLLQRAGRPYWPWAVEANTAAYGLLWVSQVSLAVFGEMTLVSLGLLTVVLFTVLTVLIRIAYGFVQRVLDLYRATAEALTAALEATVPGAAPADAALAAKTALAALALGFPERDRELVQSASWLKTILWQGPEAHGARRLVGKEDLALMEALRIADASESPGDEPVVRFRRLGFLLRAAGDSVPDGQGIANLPPDLERDDFRLSSAERKAVFEALAHVSAKGVGG